MEIPLGSLGEFLDLSFTTTKTRAQTAKTEPFSNSYRQAHGRQYSGAATTPTAKPSAKQYFSTNSRSFHNIKADNSNEGYCFTNSIKLAHERVRLQSQQQPRPMTRGVTLKARPKTTESKNSKKTTVTKKVEEDATKPLEELENNVRSELQMRANHFLIRTMKREQALINQAGVVKQSTSDNLFYELAGHVMNIHKEETRAKTPDNNHYKPTLNNLSFESAQQKLAQSSIDFWLKKRGIGKETKYDLNHFSTALFEQLDINGVGYLEGEAVLQSLLRLGIATDPTILRKTLGLSFRTNSLKTLKIHLHDFKTLFKSDGRTNSILTRMNELSLEERENKSRRTSKTERNSDYEDDSSIISSKGNKKESWFKLFKIGFGRQLTGSDFGKKKLDSIVTINEHEDLIKKWWKEIDPNEKNQVTINEVALKLAELKFAPNRNESKRIIYGIIGIKSHVSNTQFHQIFAKSMLIGSLLNLSNRLFEENSNPSTANSLKISSYQRSLIMSGIRCPNSDISIEEGSNTIKAVEKYQIQAEGQIIKVDPDELRSKMLKLAGISEIEANQRSSSMKHYRKLSGEIKGISENFFHQKSSTLQSPIKIENSQSIIEEPKDIQEISDEELRTDKESEEGIFTHKSSMRRSSAMSSKRSNHSRQEVEIRIGKEDHIEMETTTEKAKFYKSHIKPKQIVEANITPSNHGSRLSKVFDKIRWGAKVYRRFSSRLPPSEEPAVSKSISPILKDIKETRREKRSQSFTKTEAGMVGITYNFASLISKIASQPKQEIKETEILRPVEKDEEIKEKPKESASEIHWKDSSFLIVEEAPKEKRLFLPSREEYFRRLKAKEDSKKRSEAQSDLLKNYQNMVFHVPENKNFVN
ncbi:unnamed protein product [Blepharisma stoltei]|uniref:EF-hand domain-containing protein n=1 Tax=Blepharisma stoltei TaxID=1481888 RepID=A0AAU9K1B2_9CILI|nr:unnamed protein product [Blepharisma stoltei]